MMGIEDVEKCGRDASKYPWMGEGGQEDIAKLLLCLFLLWLMASFRAVIDDDNR
jgi:hypothetical protein